MTKRFTEMSMQEQGKAVEAFLAKCGRVRTFTYWAQALRGADGLDALATVERRTAADLRRLGILGAAAEADADADGYAAEAAEIRMAVAYYSPGALETWRHRVASGLEACPA